MRLSNNPVPRTVMTLLERILENKEHLRHRIITESTNYNDVRAARPLNAAGSIVEIKLVSRVSDSKPGTAAKSPAFKAGIALLLSSLKNMSRCHGTHRI